MSASNKTKILQILGKISVGDIPEKLSELENDSGYITVGVATLLNYYLKSEVYKKSETYSQSEIDIFVSDLSRRLNAIADSDDVSLDQLSEIVAFIKNNGDLIDSVTTSKVSIVDIVDNLTTNDSKKPLSAAQGVVLKEFIDELQINKLDMTSLTSAIESALAQAKESGQFNGEDVTHEWEGTVLTVTSASGISSSDLQGPRGPAGEPGTTFTPGNTLELTEDGILNVKTTDEAEMDNTLPITSSGVFTIVGNIGAILDTI